MRLQLLALLISGGLCLAAPPTDNPVNGFGLAQAYPWAASLVNWTNVVSVADFKGDFSAAQQKVRSTGGGVVFFPAGTYTFTENIALQSNVVIRGEPTYAAAKTKDGKPGPLAPATVFRCPDRKHVGIFNADKDATNLGVVNIDSDGCAIMLWPALTPKQPSFQDYWFMATDVAGMGSRKLVLGNRVRNVNLGNPRPSGDGWNTTATVSWPWFFSTAVSVYADADALVASNLLGQATASAKVNVAGFVGVSYPYDNRYGIDVNQLLLGGVYGKKVPGGNPSLCAATPQTFPWNFRPGLVIRDNYVFQNGRVGVSFSGGGNGAVGSGTQVYNNHVEVLAGSTLYTLDGFHVPGNSATNENRGYDQKGVENNVTWNTGHINRQKIGNGPFETVDGEGILVQCENGNNQYRNVWLHNDLSGGGSGYIAFFWVQDAEDNVITNNVVNQDQQIGFILGPGNVLKGNTCTGNTPATKVCNN